MVLMVEGVMIETCGGYIQIRVQLLASEHGGRCPFKAFHHVLLHHREQRQGGKDYTISLVQGWILGKARAWLTCARPAIDLLAWDEVGGVGPGVVGHGAGEVDEEVLDGTLAGDDGLHVEAEHGQAPVLDLLHLELREGLAVGIEGAAGVDGVEALAQRPAADAVAVHEPHRHNLARPDGEDALRVDQVGVAQALQPALREDLRPRLEPHRLPELDAVVGQDLREHAPQRAPHRPPRVDHLLLPVLRKRLRVR